METSSIKDAAQVQEQDIEHPLDGSVDTSETDMSDDSSLIRSSHILSPNAEDVLVVTANMTAAPSLYLCPLTHERFQDPIVSPDGETYERWAYVKQRASGDGEEEGGTTIALYPNRALKAIMEDDVLSQSDSLQASWRRLQYKAHKVVTAYFLDPTSSTSSSSSAEDTASRRDADVAFPLSHGFYCPITCNIMHDPVIDPDGNSFERVVVENWIHRHGNSPVTRRKLTIEELRPNHILQRLLEEETKMPPESMRPEILKWIDEAAPKPSDVEYGGRTADPVSSLAAEGRRRSNRRLDARRQVVYNMTGILMCILMLKFLHYSVL